MEKKKKGADRTCKTLPKRRGNGLYGGQRLTGEKYARSEQDKKRRDPK